MFLPELLIGSCLAYKACIDHLHSLLYLVVLWWVVRSLHEHSSCLLRAIWVAVALDLYIWLYYTAFPFQSNFGAESFLSKFFGEQGVSQAVCTYGMY